MTLPDPAPVRRYRRGPVMDALDALGVDRRVRANAKAMALAGAAAVKAVRQFSYAGLEVTVLSVGLDPMANGHVVLSTVVEASRGGQVVLRPDSVNERGTRIQPLQFQGPPILVSNPADPDEMVEDLPEAFRQMVGDAVRRMAERQQ